MLKKKTLLIVPIILAIIVFLSALTPALTAYADNNSYEYEPRLTAPNSSIPYYSSQKNVYFQTGTPMPNCVAYAYGRIYELNGKAPLINHGSAGDWYGINKSNGYYDYGQEPKLGAVACWSNHVAVVEKINKDGSVTISESHWGGGYFDTRTYEDMTSHFGQTFYGYIYTYDEDAHNPLLKKQKKNTQYKQKKITNPDKKTSFDKVKMDKEIEIDKVEMLFSNLLNK